MRHTLSYMLRRCPDEVGNAQRTLSGGAQAKVNLSAAGSVVLKRV